MPATRKTTLVLVDDEPVVVRVAKTILERQLGNQLDIFHTTDSKAARESLSRRRCDILISDIEMPDIHGLEMLKVARKCNAWTRVIFLTGHSTWDRLAEAIENGAADYLLKPLDHDELLQVVQQECDRLRRWRGAVTNTMKLVAG